MRITAFCCTLAAVVGLFFSAPVLAQNVKITPIGSNPGELCAKDRAIIFGDPTGYVFFMILPIMWPAEMIRAWVRFIWCCSRTCVKLRPASRTAAFMKLLMPASHLVLSERTMEFDGKGKCVAGC